MAQAAPTKQAKKSRYRFEQFTAVRLTNGLTWSGIVSNCDIGNIKVFQILGIIHDKIGFQIGISCHR